MVTALVEGDMRRPVLVCLALFSISFAAARWMKPSPTQAGNAASESADSSLLNHRSGVLQSEDLSRVLSALQDLNTSEAFIVRWNQPSDPIQRRLLLARWSGIDPEGASAFLSQSGQYESLSDLMKCWVARDPRAAIGHYKSERDKWTRNGPWEHELYQIALKHGPETMIDLAIEFDMHMRVNDITMMDDAFERWADSDRDAALKKAEELPEDTRSNVYADSVPRVNAFAGIGKSWARQNLDQALAWARGLEARDASPALHGIVAALVEEDPNAVMPYLEELERPFDYSGGQVGAGSMAVIALTKEDPVKALQWIADNVNRQDQSDVIDDVFTQYALISNPGQLASAIANVSDTKVQDMAMMFVQGYTDSKDVGSALTATLDLPEDKPVRPKLLRTFLDAWTKESPTQARLHLEAERARYGPLAPEYMDKLANPEPEKKGPVTIQFGP